MIYAVIYCRFSPRPDSNTSTSNENQEDRCLDYCEKKGYTTLPAICDRAVSGGTLERPGLQQALASLGQGMVLVVDTADRLARDMLVYLTIKQRVEEAGARIEYADGTPPAITPEGELVANIFAAFAQYQRSMIRGRTKAGLARKKAAGIHLGACPIGYRRDEHSHLVEDPEERVLVDAIMRNCSQPMGKLVRMMRDFYGPVRGKAWNERTIRRIINREMNKCTP